MSDPFFWLDGHNAIIGASDAGKTWTAKWGVEELLRQRRHTLIWDPLGVWYGLRSSADGKGAGFDIPIFGGPHGDVPITPADGAAIARIVVEQRVSAIVDASLFTNGPDQRRFARDMVAQLRRRREKANFHFVIDEADELVPEKTRDDMAFALQEDMLWIAKKGRSSGWVQTLITQRTADIAKSSLSMSQTIIAHQLISPQDQKPFLDWVRTKGTKAEQAEIEANLASLQQGERYLYSPRAHVLTLSKTPAIATFDTSRTPPPGERRREPRTLAQLDVSAIAAALAKPIEPVAADTAEVADARRALVAHADQRIFGLERRLSELQSELADVRAQRDHHARALAAIRGSADAALAEFPADANLRRTKDTPGASARKGDEVIPAATSSTEAASKGSSARSAVVAGVGSTQKDAPDKSGASTLPPAQQRILDSIAWANEAFHRASIQRQVLAIVIGVHPRTKGFLNNLGALRSAGLIDYPEPSAIALTAEGIAQATRPDIAGATLQQLRASVIRWLPPAQAGILRLAIDAFPNAIARDRVAELLNVHPRTKSLLNNLGRLRALGLLVGTPAPPRAAPYLFAKD